MSQGTVPDQALPVPPPSPRQVMLGLFILCQLFFLVVSNILGFIRGEAVELKDEPKKLANRLAPKFVDEEGHLWSWSKSAEVPLRRWMQLTGQDQDWSLFSPSAGKATGFPVVLLLWTDAPSIPGSKLDFDAKNGFHLVTPWNPPAANADVAWLRSENAPADPSHFVRFGKARLRRYEGEFWANVLPYEKPREQAAEQLTRRMQQVVNDSREAAVQYLKWRIRSWRRAHPDDPPPAQAILFEQFFRIHGPDEGHGWDGPFLVPQLRLVLGTPDAGGTEQPRVEPFDYTEQRFKPAPS